MLTFHWQFSTELQEHGEGGGGGGGRVICATTTTAHSPGSAGTRLHVPGGHALTVWVENGQLWCL